MPPSRPFPAPEPLVLDSSLAHLLVRLDAGWNPAPFFLPPVVSLALNGKSFIRQLLSCMLVGEALELRLRGREAAQLRRELATVEARTSDGGQLRGRVSAVLLQERGAEEEATTELVIVCATWSYTPLAASVLWVARLAGLTRLPGPGNTLLEGQRRTRHNRSRTALRLARAGLTSFFVATTERSLAGDVWLCLECPAPPAPEELAADLQLFRVALSLAMQPGLFYGLTADGYTMAAFAVPEEEAARPVSIGLEAPVPVRIQQAGPPQQIWVAPFYEQLAAAYYQQQTNNPVAYAVARYAHTLAPLDVDSAFLLVAGAVSVLLQQLAGFSLTTTGEATGQLLPMRSFDQTQRPTAYRQFIAGLETELAVLAQQPDDAGWLVADDLLQARLVFEQGIMRGATGPLPIGERLDRVQRLRRAYAVLLAQAIGYEGAVSDFSPRDPAQTTGWLSAPEPRAATVRLARQKYVGQADLGNLVDWPQFQVDPLPDSPLVRRFVAFADELRQTTQSRVIARLRPLPRRSEEPYRLSFRLLLPNAPATQVALFTVELTPMGLLVRGWADEPRLLPNEATLLAFEREVVFADRFRYEMQRLLLIDEDRQRGEA